jgi:hypothetical protein
LPIANWLLCGALGAAARARARAPLPAR